MKLFLKLVLVFALFNSQKSQSQTIDTLVDVGSHKLHFNIIKGKGTPILFEAGGGSLATIWNSILEPIYKTTGATLYSIRHTNRVKSAV